ncbi:MAG: poly-gamma-glutamate biosynthesis protein PgsC/CapC [Phycisphaerales bacterium]|jgi:poly-gamma-glutamate biosynthesis protein PgsC/CapC|nr:poly-gamma-glutamate biosynthesis protein PgsC/CapC [Phycisphaerales bacterium]
MLTLTLVIGIAVSLAITELTGVVAGAIIAPGYIALLLDDPRALLAVGAAVVGTHMIVSVLSPFLFLYGTRRLAVSILVGLALATGLAALRGELASELLVWAGLGYIVPGLIAHQWYRQGFLPTALALLIAAPLTRALSLMIVAVLP